MGSGADQRYNMSAIVENSYRIGQSKKDLAVPILPTNILQESPSSPSRSTIDYRLSASSAPARFPAAVTPISA